MMRIVSLVPSLTEAVATLGRVEALVGVTTFCTHPPHQLEHARRIGGTKNPDIEAIVALAPDLVLANTDEQRAQTLEELEAAGLPLMVTQTDSVDEVLDTWTHLGHALDRNEAAAEQRVQITHARRQARQRTAGHPRLTALVPIWMDPWMATGPGTYITDLLESCGFDNALSAVPEKWVRFHLSTNPSDASVVEKGPAAGQTIHALSTAPDVVLLPTEPYVFGADHRELFTPLGIPSERVRVVDGEALTWWLTRTAHALDLFSKLHEELAPVAASQAPPPQG